VADLELTRTPGDRRLYELAGVGTLRLEGLFSRSATADAGERSWHVSRRGVFTSVIEATDAAGAATGAFRGRALRRGGTLRWAQRELELRPSSVWRERYALVDGERELATIEGKGWGRRPVKLSIDDAASVDAGLLLFAAFVVRALAEDAQSAAGGAAATAGIAASG
jgi:hypothetical protein